ncbi:FkbM family methyltransferase [Vulcanisaeta sp. JCM 16159]|uniref:FkbM family methyltransferase n=1 Tax=Vulcanisaeta sp. JCM 16159 TaxID=1295371 RepID=UPI0006D21979|nr:FkbM family methyltransferase [Vulcanisaeta sp. JCM 16159]
MGLELIGDDGLVIAFEPNPETYRWLRSNIELNRARNIRALPYALGDSISIARLYIPRSNVEASSLIKDHLTKNQIGNLGLVKYYDVPVVTLDHVLSRSRHFSVRLLTA